MTKKTYDVCPQCGYDDVNVEDFEVEPDYSVYKMSCNRCDHTWREYYKMTYDGYSDDTGEYDAEGNLVCQ